MKAGGLLSACFLKAGKAFSFIYLKRKKARRKKSGEQRVSVLRVPLAGLLSSPFSLEEG